MASHMCLLRRPSQTRHMRTDSWTAAQLDRYAYMRPQVIGAQMHKYTKHKHNRERCNDQKWVITMVLLFTGRPIKSRIKIECRLTLDSGICNAIFMIRMY